MLTQHLCTDAPSLETYSLVPVRHSHTLLQESFVSLMMPHRGDRRRHRDTKRDTYHHTRTFAEKICRADYEALIKQRHWHDTSITECCTPSTKHPQRHTHLYRKQLRHSQIKDCHSTRLITSSGKTQVHQHCTYSAGRHFFGEASQHSCVGAADT